MITSVPLLLMIAVTTLAQYPAEVSFNSFLFFRKLKRYSIN